MRYIETLIQAAGGAALFLYGAKTLSRGLRQAAERGLRRLLDPMGDAQVPSILAGAAAAAALQSSNAVAALLGAFAEAGVHPLARVVGATLGACVGASAQTWIAAAALSALRFPHFAVAALGIAYFLPRLARWRNRGAGEALAGFALLAIGFSFFVSALQTADPSAYQSFPAAIPAFAAHPAAAAILAGFAGGFLTRSAGACAAFALSFGYAGCIDFGSCAALLLGAKGGSAVRETLRLGSGSPLRGRTIRVRALATGAGLLCGAALLAVLRFPPRGGAILCFAVAAFDTVSAALGAAALLPAFGRLSAPIPDPVEERGENAEPEYQLAYIGTSLRDSPELNILRAEHEIRRLAKLAERMFERFRVSLSTAEGGMNLELAAERSREDEEAADCMRETLSRFLVECVRRVPGEGEGNRVGRLLRIVGELEDMTDDCNALIRIAAKSASKGVKIDRARKALLAPYLLLLRDFLAFIRVHLGVRGSEEAFERAKGLEATINGMRDDLKRGASKRLEAGSDVRSELVFLDVVRRVEKLGDHAFAIARELRELG